MSSCPYLGSCGCWHSSPLCDCKTRAPSSGWLLSEATVNCREAAVVPRQVPCPIGAVFLSVPSFRKGQPLENLPHEVRPSKRTSVGCHKIPETGWLHMRMCFLIDLKAGSLRSECPHSVGAGSFPGLQMAAFSPCPPVAFVLCTDGEGQFCRIHLTLVPKCIYLGMSYLSSGFEQTRLSVLHLDNLLFDYVVINGDLRCISRFLIPGIRGKYHHT